MYLLSVYYLLSIYVIYLPTIYCLSPVYLAITYHIYHLSAAVSATSSCPALNTSP